MLPRTPTLHFKAKGLGLSPGSHVSESLGHKNGPRQDMRMTRFIVTGLGVNYEHGSWWTFRIFFILLLGGGEGRSRGREGGGGSFFMENPRRGVSPAGGGGGRGAGRVFEGNFWGGGGAIFFFFSGPKFPPRVSCMVPSCESANFRWIANWEPN